MKDILKRVNLGDSDNAFELEMLLGKDASSKSIGLAKQQAPPSMDEIPLDQKTINIDKCVNKMYVQ